MHAMPCEMSPLGYHLRLAVKEKIWKGEFVDILSLLPLHKDFMAITEKKEEWSEGGRRRPIPRSFNNWLQAYCIYLGIMAEKNPELCGGPFPAFGPHFGSLQEFGGAGAVLL